jgi:hypothetical protein
LVSFQAGCAQYTRVVLSTDLAEQHSEKAEFGTKYHADVERFSLTLRNSLLRYETDGGALAAHDKEPTGFNRSYVSQFGQKLSVTERSQSHSAPLCQIGYSRIIIEGGLCVVGLLWAFSSC